MSVIVNASATRASSRSRRPGRVGWLGVLGLLVCAVQVSAAGRFEIGLVGDLPYTGEDEQKFPALMRALDAAPLAFVVHMGDIESDARGFQVFKTGKMPCTDETLESRKALFNASRHAFILTPGDNDWTDCRYSAPAFDPLERLAHLRTLFFAGKQSLGHHPLALARQSEDPRYAKYSENARWSYGGVLFATIHVVGSNNNLGNNPENDAEFAERTAADLAWIHDAFEQATKQGSRAVMILTQANPYFESRSSTKPPPQTDATPPAAPTATPFGALMDELERETLAFGRPVVFVHGDTHYFRIDKPLLGTRSGRTLENFTRVEVFGSPNVHWVRAFVDPADPGVFTFRAEVVPENRVEHGSR